MSTQPCLVDGEWVVGGRTVWLLFLGLCLQHGNPPLLFPTCSFLVNMRSALFSLVYLISLAQGLVHTTSSICALPMLLPVPWWAFVESSPQQFLPIFPAVSIYPQLYPNWTPSYGSQPTKAVTTAKSIRPILNRWCVPCRRRNPSRHL